VARECKQAGEVVVGGGGGGTRVSSRRRALVGGALEGLLRLRSEGVYARHSTVQGYLRESTRTTSERHVIFGAQNAKRRAARSSQGSIRAGEYFK
jgi:hypothetical protein